MSAQTTIHELPKSTHGLETFLQSYESAMDIVDTHLVPPFDAGDEGKVLKIVAGVPTWVAPA